MLFTLMMSRTLSTSSARTALSVVSLAALVACGGDGGSDTTAAPSATATAATTTLQTYITDNLATEYSKVWVSIRKITAQDSTGTEVTLLDSTATPTVVNLASLAAVGQLMSSVTVPTGLYTQVNVTMGNDVQLVSLDGPQTVEAKFAASATEYVWKIRNVELNTATSGQLILDFDLEHFTYNATTGLVSPSIVLKSPSEAFGRFVRQQAEAHGTVQSVDTTARTLTITDPHLGSHVVVSLTSDASVVNAQTGAAMSLADVTVGARLHIKGTVTPGATTADPVTVSATLIQVDPASSTSTSTAALNKARGEGTVASVDGSVVTVTLSEANFLPGSNTVKVDISSARFAHGQSSSLVAGVDVSFRGTLSGTGGSAKVVANVIDIEGAAPNTSSSSSSSTSTGTSTSTATTSTSTSTSTTTLSEVEGSITQLNSDGTFTVTVSDSSTLSHPHPWTVAAGTYTVDPSKAVYRAGTSSCLVVGNQVEALGTLSSTTLAATRLKVKGCGGQSYSRTH